jgi:hypothetical protein
VVRRVSTFVRGWIFIAAFAQAMLPGIVSVIDADDAGNAASAAVRPHIEDHGTPKCPRVHQEDNCALCQFVSGLLAPEPHAEPLSFNESAALHVAAVRQELPTWQTSGVPSLPRAPPVKA